MKKKNKVLQKLEALKSTPPVKVRKSYYTFSKDYPAGHIPLKRRRNTRVKSRPLKIILYVCVFALLVGVSFFTVQTGLNISYRVPDSEETESTPAEAESLLQKGSIKALYMPAEKLGDSKYIGQLIRQVRKRNANSVLIEFKAADGSLNYTSMQEYAIAGRCSVFDNNTVRRAVDLFRSEKITVIASVHCFEDAAVASAVQELAVKYMQTDINWLDGSDDNGGKPWLNPCLRRNQNYIVGVLGELYNLGVRGFVLESCQFPGSENASVATYPGEKNYKSRNDVLLSFLKKARRALNDDAFILLGLSAADAQKGNLQIFDGSLSAAAIDGIAPDISQREAEYIIDKKTSFASMLSLYSEMSSAYKDKALIPIVSTQEYSKKFFSTMKKAGYDSYILYNSEGKY